MYLMFLKIMFFSLFLWSPLIIRHSFLQIYSINVCDCDSRYFFILLIGLYKLIKHVSLSFFLSCIAQHRMIFLKGIAVSYAMSAITLYLQIWQWYRVHFLLHYIYMDVPLDWLSTLTGLNPAYPEKEKYNFLSLKYLYCANKADELSIRKSLTLFKSQNENYIFKIWYIYYK